MDKYLRLTGGVGSCIFAKHKEGEAKTFKMNAYNGGAMNVGQFFLPIVIDLKGMAVSKKQRPILLNHDPDRPVGHSVDADGGNGVENTGKKVNVTGVFSFENDNTEEIQGAASRGFLWQASVGVSVLSVSRIPEGEKADANGKTFVGPVLIARRSVLKEVSFVPLGADDSTSVKVAANATQEKEMEFCMDPKFEAWLKANGYDVNKISSDVEAALKPLWEKEVKAAVDLEAKAKKEKEKGKGKKTEVELDLK